MIGMSVLLFEIILVPSNLYRSLDGAEADQTISVASRRSDTPDLDPAAHREVAVARMPT